MLKMPINLSSLHRNKVPSNSLLQERQQSSYEVVALVNVFIYSRNAQNNPCTAILCVCICVCRDFIRIGFCICVNVSKGQSEQGRLYWATLRGSVFAFVFLFVFVCVCVWVCVFLYFHLCVHVFVFVFVLSLGRLEWAGTTLSGNFTRISERILPFRLTRSIFHLNSPSGCILPRRRYRFSLDEILFGVKNIVVYVQIFHENKRV